MHIGEITFRNRNDFHFIAECRHCGKKSRHGDGYADAFYQGRVFPARCCEHCGLNEYGETADEAERAESRTPA
jgi:hypothetical protein